jgi:hypothetical protein
LHIQPSELDNLEYYEYHYLIKDLIEHLKNEQKNQQGEKDQTQGMMSNMKMPSFKMPNMSMPKMR